MKEIWQWHLPARGISGIEKFSTKKPINQNELRKCDENQKRPDETFALAQSALARGGKPELQFYGTKRDGVAVAENFVLDGLAVDGCECIGGGCEIEAFFFLEF